VAKHMLKFALPLFIGNMFQQFYNTADALIVGNLLGSEALASVAGTNSLIFLLVSFFGGISMGAGVVISRYFGARDTENMRIAIHTNVAFGLSAGLLLTILGTTLTPVILRLMGTPEDIIERSISYVRIYFAGSLSLVMYNTCMGTMQAVGDSRHPLYYLIISSLVNIVLDYVFIRFFHGNVGSAALATVISQFFSVLLCLIRLMRTHEDYRISLKEIRFNWPILKQIVRFGLPSGLQNSVTAIANVVIQANINAFGTMATAGCGAYAKLEGFAFLPIMSLNSAITTFVGQNLGAKQYKRARQGAKFGVISSLVMAQLIGLVFYLFAPSLIKLFTQEPEAIAFGVLKARTCTLFYFVLAMSHCLSAVLRGAGKATVPMVTMLLIWCVFRVIFLSVMIPITQTIDLVNWIYPITWCMTATVLTIYYVKADWVHGFEAKSKKAG